MITLNNSDQISAIISGNPLHQLIAVHNVDKIAPIQLPCPFFSISDSELCSHFEQSRFATVSKKDPLSHGALCGDGYSIYLKDNKWIFSFSERGFESTVFSRHNALHDAELAFCRKLIYGANLNVWSWNNQRLRKLNLPTIPNTLVPTF